MCVYMPQLGCGGQPFVSVFTFTLSKTGYLIFSAGYAKPLSLLPGGLSLQTGVSTVSLFYVGTWDLNSDAHVCTVSTLCTETYLQIPTFL